MAAVVVDTGGEEDVEVTGAAADEVMAMEEFERLETPLVVVQAMLLVTPTAFASAATGLYASRSVVGPCEPSFAIEQRNLYLRLSNCNKRCLSDPNLFTHCSTLFG